MLSLYKRRSFKVFKLLLLTGLFLATTTIFAEGLPKSEIKFFYIEDDSNQYDINRINYFHQKNLLRQETNSLNLSFAASTVWIKVPLKPITEQTILVIQNAHLDHVDLYLFSGDSLISSKKSGDLVNFSNRDINSNYINFFIPANTSTIFLKVNTEGPMMVPLKILSYKEYVDYLTQFSAFHYIYFGFIFLIVISNVVLFMWLKELLNLYYCLFLLSLGLITAIDFEYTFQYLWPTIPNLNKYNAILYLLTGFTAFFSEKLFNLKKRSPRLYRVYQGIYVLFGSLAIAMLFLSYRLSIEIVFYVLLVVPLLCLATGIYFFYKYREEFLRFFIVGWITFLPCIFIYTFSIADFLPFNFITGNIVQIGSCIEIIFFNMAVLSRINLLKREKERLLFEQNKMQEEVNKELVDKNRRLQQFAYVTNHNLRGPVATLLGLSNIFNKSDVADPHNLSIIEKTKETAYKIDAIVKDLNSLLYLNKGVEAILQPINLFLVMNKVKIMLANEIEESNAIINYDFSKASVIHGVPDYVDNIFFNLISNSIKFTKEFTIPEIDINTTENETEIIVLVKDNGLGINLNKYKEQLFQPYKKLHGTISGKGLGLYLVKEQMESMNGKVEIESQLGSGTVFTLTFKKLSPIQLKGL